MKLKKYRLADIGKVITGKTPSTSIAENYACGNIPFYTPEDVAKGLGMMGRNNRFISQTGFEEIASNTISGESVLVGCIGSDMGNVAYSNITCATNQQINSITQFKNGAEPLYVYYLLSTMKPYFQKIAGSTTTPILPKSVFEEIEIYLPGIKYQKDIVSILYALDRKIALNHQINDNLEAMAKQLYDYWFVQFDFPNEEEKPYKSSGGAMVWNEELHMNIPYSWNTCLLNDYIGSNNTGDWGFDEPAEKRNMKVGCIRGADIVKLNDLPTRYIKDSNTSKLLSVWDIVIEVSGGSPTQATGRSAFVTPGVLKRNGGNLTCSNFCHAFTMKNYKASAYFFFMWRMFYDNNNMFNYEGKTSGIKNFMTDTFLANKWLDVPTALLDLFFERIKVIYEQIDNNIEEINALTKQRDELLPLLMNGQASVNYHLSARIDIPILNLQNLHYTANTIKISITFS